MKDRLRELLEEYHYEVISQGDINKLIKLILNELELRDQQWIKEIDNAIREVTEVLAAVPASRRDGFSYCIGELKALKSKMEADNGKNK